MVAYSSLLTFGLLAIAELVAGHGAIIAATGDAGGQGSAIGIDPDTPRDGTRRRPFQQDTTRFQGDAADTVGETLAGGDNDIETGTAAVLAQNGGTLPQITPGGEVQMTLHQVNADGAGPYTCMINDDGTATSWTQMTVTQQVPGRRGSDRDGAETDFPLTASVPAGQTCTGTVAGEDNVCLVRCQNPARAGPFGGVVPVQMASAADTAATATNGTATADSTTAAAASSTTATAASSTAATGDAEDIAAADGNANGVSANQQAAANAADDKRKAKRSSRVERRSAAGVSYRQAIKFRA